MIYDTAAVKSWLLLGVLFRVVTELKWSLLSFSKKAMARPLRSDWLTDAVSQRAEGRIIKRQIDRERGGVADMMNRDEQEESCCT